MYEKIIAGCPLFAGLEGEELEHALECFSAVKREYRKGEFLNRIGEAPEYFGLVLSGAVQVYTDDIDGHHMIMANVGAGETFGESLCYLRREAAVTICALEDSVVLRMRADRIRDLSVHADPRDIMLAGRFTAMLAGRTLRMNERIQVLSRLTIRDKLRALFTQAVHENGSGRVRLSFGRNDMAAYLGVNRSALSRELGAMRREGLIDFYKNEFEILKSFSEKE